MKRPEIVLLIKQALRQIVPGARIILYGSEARGDARPDSDIDQPDCLYNKAMGESSY